MAKIVSWATAGVDPSVMGTGPVPASRKALEKAGWKVSDLDLVESNEAFAAQSLAVMGSLGLDPAKRKKVARYYHQLETGLLDPRRVSGRVFEALGDGGAAPPR